MKQGDKVICIDIKNLASEPNSFDKLLIEGGIYHIREMIPGYEYKGQPDGVKLDEIIGKVGKLLCHDSVVRSIETHFRQSRFRVIDEIDIGNLEEIRKDLITILNEK
jgi:hypothetical protein